MAVHGSFGKYINVSCLETCLSMDAQIRTICPAEKNDELWLLLQTDVETSQIVATFAPHVEGLRRHKVTQPCLAAELAQLSLNAQPFSINHIPVFEAMEHG